MLHRSFNSRAGLSFLRTCALRAEISSMAATNDIGHSPVAFEESNPVDIYRSHISELLAPIAQKPAKDINERLSWTQTFDKGDLGLAVPSLRVPPKEASAKASEWGENFPSSDLVEKPTVAGTFLQFFFKPQPLTKLVIPSILQKRHSMGQTPGLVLRTRRIHQRAKSA